VLAVSSHFFFFKEDAILAGYAVGNFGLNWKFFQVSHVKKSLGLMLLMRHSKNKYRI
jgi:hypothetical protein